MFRRQFLKTSGLLSLAPMVPQFVNRLAASTNAETDQRILVVIELNGGNDGINTLVPHADDEYRKARPKLALDPATLHSISDSMGLHRSMRASKEMFDAGELAIVNGVSYPNPNRSHFDSLDIWHQGRIGARRESGAGWIGHAMDLGRKADSTGMDGYFVGREAVWPAMIGRRAQVAALSRFADLQLASRIQPVRPAAHDEDIASFVQRQVSDSYFNARRLESAMDNVEVGAGFPDGRLGQQLRLVSQLIKSGSAARVYYTIQGGYDTHSIQLNSHADLLFELSWAMKAFVDDLKKDSLDDRVVVMAFSEFGRRVNENVSMGTDHGTAGPVFVAGSPVRAGLIGQATNLTDLTDGDLKPQFDFRQVYASLLDKWLGNNSIEVLGESFEHLELV